MTSLVAEKAVEEMNGLVDTYDWAEQEFGTKVSYGFQGD